MLETGNLSTIQRLILMVRSYFSSHNAHSFIIVFCFVYAGSMLWLEYTGCVVSGKITLLQITWAISSKLLPSLPAVPACRDHGLISPT